MRFAYRYSYTARRARAIGCKNNDMQISWGLLGLGDAVAVLVPTVNSQARSFVVY